MFTNDAKMWFSWGWFGCYLVIVLLMMVSVSRRCRCGRNEFVFDLTRA